MLNYPMSEKRSQWVANDKNRHSAQRRGSCFVRNVKNPKNKKETDP